ncbi:uncharacterized protein LOC122001762 isoform X1 [Zingiber officinale]|uniref:uncharacterized protein LOC122001762 isoform X1 n=1 Tax=Zingiber officinale TaxID=94328 RepID=UPI001C4D4564|nr:uncharacterized protein LOC122001762 isoform X1 [Zingiber officinale]
MAESLPLPGLVAGEALPPSPSYRNPDSTPNPPPLPSISRCSAAPPWEAMARAWLASLPIDHYPSASEIDSFIDANSASFPVDTQLLPRSQLHLWILSFHEASSGLNQVSVSDLAEFPYRFQRTDLWKPAYRWLESLDRDELVNAKEVSEWLTANPEVAERLVTKHSRYHTMHYIQRMHLKLLKKKGKLPKGLQLSVAKASLKSANNGVTSQEFVLPGKILNYPIRKEKMVLHKNKEAFLRYELLTDLQNQLTSVLLKQKQATDSKEFQSSFCVKQKPENVTTQSSDIGKNDTRSQIFPGGASLPHGVVNVHIMQVSKPTALSEMMSGRKRKRNPVIVTPAWCYSEASSDASEIDQLSNSRFEEGTTNIWKGDMYSSFSRSSFQRQNILMCLQGREQGFSWRSAHPLGGSPGRNREKWIPFLEGWRSLGKQFEGPAAWLTHRSYSSWVPIWSAYTSSVAVVQPIGRQGVQKVLNVRFHPDGLPQLVCSSNQAPNELLLYNLLSGKAAQLNGHNCRIQAVEFAARGASIVSCSSNLLKVWDCTTGSCLFNLGSVNGDGSTVGHKEKIIAMTVNRWQSCLVVTSGAKGDGKLLLWNALRGELDADLNSSLRPQDQAHPSIIAMEFCSENMLIGGSDCEYGGPAVVQLWDIESPKTCCSFSAHESYITSLKTNPTGNTIITGAGDGTIGLFDIRTCATINHLSVGPGFEVTSVSFSSCGTYFTASGTSNNTLVWDTRVLPMNCVQLAHESNDMRFLRPLHCLSHGKQMPTAEYAGQVPGHVEKGDEGVNDARWLQTEPVLVTVSGDGSMAMWNVTLGQPCVRHLFSHKRCSNTVAVAPNDEYLCTGGDDQKIVLYHKKDGGARLKWRLTHPLQDDN